MFEDACLFSILKIRQFLKGVNATGIHSIFNPLLQQSLVHHNSPWWLWLAVQITEHFYRPITACWWQQSVPLGEGRAEGKVRCIWARLQMKQHLLSCTSPAGRRECHRNVANTSNSSGNAIMPLLSDKSTGYAAKKPSWTCPRKGTSISTTRFTSRLEPLTPAQKPALNAKPWRALHQGFYPLLCWFCMPCLPLLILNRMGGCKFTIGDMSVFAQHALYTFINFVLNGGCDFTPGGNQG